MASQNRNPMGSGSTQLKRVVSYFDNQASYYSCRYSETSLGGYGFRVRKQRVLELIGESRGKVLDVGCGPGIMVPDLVSRGFEFWGIDASPNMIKECHVNFPEMDKSRFSVTNATALEFPSEFFDIVVCTGVIERIEEYGSAISEMQRVLKTDGACIITFPNLYSPQHMWRKFFYNPTVDFLKGAYSRLTGAPATPPLSSFVRSHRAIPTRKVVAEYFREVADPVYFNFNIFLSPLDVFFSRFATSTTQMLESHHIRGMNWMGAGFILKAIK